MGDSFAHLHLHTEFSMLDGAARVNDVIAAAVADGQPAIGITDHGNMYGVLDFYKECREPGRQADHRHRGVHGRRVPRTSGPSGGAASTTEAGTAEEGEKLYYHLTLLAENTDRLPQPA